MVEGTPLLRVHLGKTWIQGSNPCVSASKNDETRMANSFAGFSFSPGLPLGLHLGIACRPGAFRLFF